MKKILDYSPFIFMLIVAIFVGTIIYKDSGDLLMSAFVGSCSGVLLVWFTIFILYRVYLVIFRGAPFKVEDKVLVISGEFKGRVGVVTKVVDEQHGVFVNFNNENDDEYFHFMEWGKLKTIDRFIWLKKKLHF